MKLLAFVCVAMQFFTINSKVIDGLFPEPCSRSNPNLKTCVSSRLPKILSHVIKNGLPEFDIPKADPFEQPRVVFDVAASKMTSARGLLKNIKIVGLLKYFLNDVKIDGEMLTLELLITHPQVYATTEAKFVGKLFDVPLKFEGHLEGNFTDIISRCKISFDVLTKDGVEFLVLKKLNFKSAIGGMQVRLVAKDEEAQHMYDIATTYLNDNFKQVLDFVHPYYEEITENILKTIFLEKAFAALPLEKVFSS